MQEIWKGSAKSRKLRRDRSLPATSAPTQDHGHVIAAEWLESLISRGASVDALRAHRLHLAAARLWRSRGLPVPAALQVEERIATIRAIAARTVLERVRAAYDGSLILMKGPEVAACYPVASDRPFGDLDLIADDPPAALAALLAAGFVELAAPADYAKHHHLCPVALPGIPLPVELHHRANQPPWLEPVPSSRLFDLSVPSVTGVEDLLAPEPAVHAVLLVAHSWTHEPLRRLGDLLDVAAVLAAADRDRATGLAREWGWEGMWRTTLSAVDAMLGRRTWSLALQPWTRHLRDPRARTVLEQHITRTAAPATSLPLSEVPRAILDVMKDTITPGHDEGWLIQARRSCVAFAHAFMNASQHERSLSSRGLS